jgi:hypothetical protein
LIEKREGEELLKKLMGFTEFGSGTRRRPKGQDYGAASMRKAEKNTRHKAQA